MSLFSNCILPHWFLFLFSTVETISILQRWSAIKRRQVLRTPEDRRWTEEENDEREIENGKKDDAT